MRFSNFAFFVFLAAISTANSFAEIPPCRLVNLPTAGILLTAHTISKPICLTAAEFPRE